MVSQQYNILVFLDEKGFRDWRKPRPEKTLAKVFEGESSRNLFEGESNTIKVFEGESPTTLLTELRGTGRHKTCLRVAPLNIIDDFLK